MTKNSIISILVIVVLLGGGYYLLKSKPASDSVTDTTTPKTPTTPSAPVTGVKAEAPTVQTNTGTTVSSSTAVVAGQVKPNGATTKYWFEYGETTALGNRTVTQEVGSGFTLTSTPAYITGLRSNTLYYFRLSASNRFATVNGATYTFQTNNNPPPSGVAPVSSTKNATDVSRTTANLNGQVNPNGWQTNYWFEYGGDTGLGNITSITSAGNGNTLSSVAMSLSSLQPQTKYYFRLNAQNQYGTVNGSILNFTTQGPVSASVPTVTTNQQSNVTSSAARLNGRINPNGAETNYWFEYSQDSLLGSLIGGGTPSQTLSGGTENVNVQANISNLSRNTKYYYRLVGRNQSGTVQGGIMSFTTRN